MTFYPLATNKADATATATDHPTHHNQLAGNVNDFVAAIGGVDLTGYTNLPTLIDPNVTDYEDSGWLNIKYDEPSVSAALTLGAGEDIAHYTTTALGGSVRNATADYSAKGGAVTTALQFGASIHEDGTTLNNFLDFFCQGQSGELFYELTDTKSHLYVAGQAGQATPLFEVFDTDFNALSSIIPIPSGNGVSQSWNALADDDITGVTAGLSVTVDDDGTDRLGGFTLSTTSNLGEDGTVFAEVGDTRAVLFVGALASQTVPMFDLQNSLGASLFNVTPTSLNVAIPHTDGIDALAFNGTAITVSRQDDAGQDRARIDLDDTGIEFSHSDSDGLVRAVIDLAFGVDDEVTWKVLDDSSPQRERVATTMTTGGFGIVTRNASNAIQSTFELNEGYLNVAAVHGSGSDTITMDGTTVSLVRKDNAGAEKATITLSDTGVAVVTDGTFTYNGDEVAVVP